MNNSSVWNSCDFPIRKIQEKWWTCNFVSSIIFFLLLLQCKEKMRPVKRALKMLESPEGTMTEKDQVSQTRQVDFYFSFLVPLTQLCLTRSRGDYKISMKNELKTSPVELLPVRIFLPGFKRWKWKWTRVQDAPSTIDPFWSILTHFYQSTCLSILKKIVRLFWVRKQNFSSVNCAILLSVVTTSNSIPKNNLYISVLVENWGSHHWNHISL